MRKVVMACLLVLLQAQLTAAQEVAPLVVVLDLTGSGVSEADRTLIGNLLTFAFDETYMVDTVPRNEWENVLYSRGDTNSVCGDISCALNIGKLVEVDIVIIGSVERTSGKLAVELRGIDVDAGAVVAGHQQVYGRAVAIMENVNQIALQLAQDITGKSHPDREVLMREGLTVLRILSSHEGAEATIDNIPAGEIHNGELLKILPSRDIYTLELKMRGYYPYKETHTIEERIKTVQIELERKTGKRIAWEGVVGGGVMASVRCSFFPALNKWYITAGLGFTPVCLDPVLIGIPLSVGTGLYFGKDDRKTLRFYTGMMFYLVPIRIFDWRILYDGELVRMDDSSIFLGAEYKLSPRLRVATEVFLFPGLIFNYAKERSWVQLAAVLKVK